MSGERMERKVGAGKEQKGSEEKVGEDRKCKEAQGKVRRVCR